MLNLVHLLVFKEILSPRVDSGFLLLFVFIPPVMWCLNWFLVSILAARRKQWGLAVVSCAWIVLVLCLTLGFGSQDSQRTGRRLRVVSVNVGAYFSDLESISKSIAELDPDIVLLQELWWRKHLNTVSRYLPEHDVAGVFPKGFDDVLPGVVLLSNRPVLEVESVVPQRFIRVKVSVEDDEVWEFVSLHGVKSSDGASFLTSPMELSRTARLQFRQYLRAAGEGVEKTRFVVAGDMNSPACASWSRAAFAGLHEITEESGSTFPAAFPVLRLDRAYLSTDLLRTADAHIVDVGSDHRAIVLDFF